MSSDIPLLSNVQVAAPCSAGWNDMEAIDGDRVHFCAGCKRNVYNLSAMTQAQAEGLLRKHEGHLCVRYYKRTDGTILTQNCPVGQAALRMQMVSRSKIIAIVVTMFGAMYYGGRTVEPRVAMGMCLFDTPEPPDTMKSVIPRRQELPTGDETDHSEPDGGFVTGSMALEPLGTSYKADEIRAEGSSLGMHVPENTRRTEYRFEGR